MKVDESEAFMWFAALNFFHQSWVALVKVLYS